MSAPSSAAALTRLTREWAIVQRAPVAGTTLEVAKGPTGADDYFQWKGTVTGPEEYVVKGERRACPYAGAVFNVTVTFPENYPFSPPKVAFEVGKLYHPNVSPVDGTMCENLLTATWGPTKKATDVLAVITSFLSQPNFEAVIDDDAAVVISTDIAKYEAQARRAATGARK